MDMTGESVDAHPTGHVSCHPTLYLLKQQSRTLAHGALAVALAVAPELLRCQRRPECKLT